MSKIKNVFPGFTSARLEKQAGKNVADATFKWTDWLLFPLKFTVSYFHVSQTFSSIYNFSKTSIIFGKLLRVLQAELASEQICWFSYDYEITNNFRKLCKIYSSHKTFIKHNLLLIVGRRNHPAFYHWFQTNTCIAKKITRNRITQKSKW